MITKITLSQTKSRSFIPSELCIEGVFGQHTFEQLTKQSEEERIFYERVNQFTHFLLVNGKYGKKEYTVKEMIEFYFWKDPSITIKSKTKRVYFVDGLYIHEEDKK